jgi:biopolymer transport protein ExbB/TolQ
LQSIHDLLYVLSNAFLLPTLLGTLAAFGYGAHVIGRFLSETADRRVNRASLKRLHGGNPTEQAFHDLPWRTYFARFRDVRLKHAGSFPAMVDKELSDIEHELHARVERLGIMSKVGPMLGLIGTLIPLQPALAGLAHGDMQAMGANLQIGFTTTVLGLLVGGACYAVSTILKNWYAQDLTDLHFLQALWTPADSTEHEKDNDESREPGSALSSRNGAGLAKSGIGLPDGR